MSVLPRCTSKAGGPQPASVEECAQVSPSLLASGSSCICLLHQAKLTCVVLDDQQAARRAGDRPYRSKHGLRSGAGKDVATNGGGQHAVSDVPGVRGLVAAASTCLDKKRLCGMGVRCSAMLQANNTMVPIGGVPAALSIHEEAKFK